MSVRCYQELFVWQRAMDLVVRVYEVTESFPHKEQFGLTNQLRRAAVSIPSNIAEGQGRQTTRDFLTYLSIARGSLQEVETQILIATRLDYIAESEKLRCSRGLRRQAVYSRASRDRFHGIRHSSERGHAKELGVLRVSTGAVGGFSLTRHSPLATIPSHSLLATRHYRKGS